MQDYTKDQENTIRRAVVQLNSESVEEATSAAKLLFDLAHMAQPDHETNKLLMGELGAVPALCRLIAIPMEETIYQACSALSEMAFKNERNCLAIVYTANALQSLVKLLQVDHGNNQEDAALVVNNCAAFCEDASPIIASCEGMVDALKKLAVCGVNGGKNVAVGALNCLSRSRHAAEILRQSRVVEDSLVFVLRQEGSGEKYEARLARATMALANLTCACQPIQDFSSYFAESDKYNKSMETIVRILGYALNGQKWAGIFFAPYSVMFPLYNLSLHPPNREPLVACGLLELLTRLMTEWQPQRQADNTLFFALSIGSALSSDWDWRQRMRHAGMVAALQDVRAGRRGEPSDCRSAADRLLLALLDDHMAVWMGQHSRLGSRSLLLQLDDYVAGIVLEYAFGARICRAAAAHTDPPRRPVDPVPALPKGTSG